MGGKVVVVYKVQYGEKEDICCIARVFGVVLNMLIEMWGCPHCPGCNWELGPAFHNAEVRRQVIQGPLGIRHPSASPWEIRSQRHRASFIVVTNFKPIGAIMQVLCECVYVHCQSESTCIICLLRSSCNSPQNYANPNPSPPSLIASNSCCRNIS